MHFYEFSPKQIPQRYGW